MHVQKIGWQDWKSDGQTAGTTGRRLRTEALEVKLTGAIADQYDVYYRVHVQKIGWMGWAKNGDPAGTQGMARRAEAVQICLVKKGAAAPANDGATAQAFMQTPSVSYRTSVQGIGWQDWCSDGVTAGTTGQSKQVELFNATLAPESTTGLAGGIQYRAHVQGTGWQEWVADGADAGVKGKRTEALQMNLTGAAASQFSVWYRVHIQTGGWLGWAHDGETAGSTGVGLRVEAVQVVIRAKGSGAPGSTAGHQYTSTAMVLARLNTATGSGSIRTFGDTSFSMSSAAGQQLQAAVNALGGYDLGFVMVDLSTGAGIARSATNARYSASTIKGPYVAAVNRYNPGAVSGWARSTMDSTIKYSSNEGYASLRRTFGAGPMAQLMSSVGVSSFASNSDYVYYSPRDLAKLWVGCYQYFYRDTNYNSAWCRGLYTYGLTGGNAVLHNALSSRYTVLAKPGWYPGGGHNVQNDAGIVLAGDGPYVVAIMSSACGQYGKLEAVARALDAVHSAMV